MDVLVDSREVLRNDALILLIQLTKGNSDLQKIVAFENAFDKLVDIIEVEGYSDGGIVVEDCLRFVTFPTTFPFQIKKSAASKHRSASPYPEPRREDACGHFSSTTCRASL